MEQLPQEQAAAAADANLLGSGGEGRFHVRFKAEGENVARHRILLAEKMACIKAPAANLTKESLLLLVPKLGLSKAVSDELWFLLNWLICNLINVPTAFPHNRNIF